MFLFLTAMPLSSAFAKVYFSDVLVSYYDEKNNALKIELNEGSQVSYPETLAKEGFKGCALFESRIISGKAENLTLISTGSGPAIAQEAQKMIRSWGFQNKLEPKPIKIKVNYCLGGRSAQQVQSMCARQAQMQC